MADIQHMHMRAAWGLALLLASCGGGGGGSGGGPTEPGVGAAASTGVVRLLDHEPAAEATQVPTDGRITLRFDARTALDSFGDADTWLRVDGVGANVAGSFQLGSLNRVHFTPAASLQPETDYVFQLSALTCDEDGRILDQEVRFRFRTIDTTAPTLVAVDVADGAMNVARDRAFRFTFSERIAPASASATTAYLRDVFGARYKAALACDGTAVALAPSADLPGDRQLFLVATTGLRDVAGNALAASSSTAFRTVADADPPAVVGAWPAPAQQGVSPRAEPRFQFDESMDPATVESSSLTFVDEYGALVPFAIAASDDQRSLRVVPRSPLAADRSYTLSFALGAAAATDVSGNPLSATQQRVFRTGADASPPQLVASEPSDGADRVPADVVVTVDFDEALDPAWVADGTVTLFAGEQAWETLVEAPTADTLRVTPLVPLPIDTACSLRLRGGPSGLRDPHGNTLPADVTLTFTTSGDAGTPAVMILPPDGAIDVPANAQPSVAFDAPMDLATLHGGTLMVTDDAGAPVAGTWLVAPSGRSARFAPAQALPAGQHRRVSVRAGQDGVRRASGNWLRATATARFRIGAGADLLAPTVRCTVNGIASARQQGLTLPPSGFTIDVEATDGYGGWTDVASAQLLLSGPAAAPDEATVLREGSFGLGFARLTVPAEARLAVGDWTLRVRAPDVAGNLGTSAPLTFRVAEPVASIVPFDRTQVVWVRAEMDRDGNGAPDLDDDMLRLGLASNGGHAGAIAFTRELLLTATLRQANRLYGRGPRGEPQDGATGVRFTTRAPIRIAHMQIALGGFDPEGPRNRGFGDASTGVLGRALFDLRNGNPAERNTSQSPGLGVFPAEMFAYQSRLHQQVWPSFTTRFAERFLPLCPDMGGTPVGAHAHDAAVLTPTYDEDAATSSQRARRQTVLQAVDDWAAMVGIVLAHEVGHSVGLVAPGDAPNGLYGDASLHNSFAGATEVMSASVGYESMVTLAYAFRDLDLAYLRHRALLR